MFNWGNKEQRKKLHQLNKELEGMLGGKVAQPRGGYNDQAKKLRGEIRDVSKKEAPNQVIKEETRALEEGKLRTLKTSRDGQNLAKDVVEVTFWEKLFKSKKEN